METLLLVMTAVIGLFMLKSKQDRERIALLGHHLGKHQIEKLMETLTQGYLRALGEDDPERRAQIWSLLASSEAQLCEQFSSFVTGFASVDESAARTSKLVFPIPFAEKLFPGSTFDMRKLLSVHARGITQAARNSQGLSPKNKAFVMSAELFLMQHTCHWFCKSRAVASARMMARHKTPYAQLINSVAPETRQAYAALIAG